MPDGLLYAMLLDGKGGGRTLTWSEVEQWQADQGLLWLHFDITREAAAKWIVEEGRMDDVIAEAMVHEENRPRATAHGDGLMLSLRGVNLNPGADPEDMVSIRLWVEPRRIISTRRRKLLSVGDMVKWLEAGEGPQDAPQFIFELTERMIERMVDVMDMTQDQVDAFEERLLLEQTPELRADLSQLRRQLVGLRRYLAPMREALNRLQTERLTWITSAERLQLRELSDRLARLLEELDMARERSALIQEQLTSALSDQLNHRLYVLSVVAAIFLPLSFLTGLFGINVGGIPGASYGWAFLIFVVALLFIMVGQLWLFKRNNWL